MGVSEVFSQADYRNGYIITNEGDTTHGYLDYRGDVRNCNKCLFKLNEHSEPVEYLPSEIKAYRFADSKFYISYFLEELSEEVFIEFLIEGIVDIYYYKDLTNEFYFASKNDSELIKLENEKIQIEIDQKFFEKESNKYKRVLSYLFSDSELDLNKINNVGLDHKPLINIAKDYHNNVCLDEKCIVYEKKMAPIKLDYYVLFFSDIVSLFIGEVDQYAELNFNNKVSYSLGLGLSFNLPRLNERITVYSQVLYCDYSVSSNYFTEDILGSYLTTSNVEIQSLNNNIGFKFLIPLEKVKPEITTSLVYNLVLKSNIERTVEEESLFSGDIIYNYSDNLITNSIGFMIGASMNIFEIKNVETRINVQYSYTYGRVLEGSRSNPGKYAVNYLTFTNNNSVIRFGLSFKLLQ
ncbi:MAG: hypothetical protein C0597_08785 [Marinilabiliales bacterium]|nr:MAG: hypothetical protein C0597_08785 [Marinilabiliales bacterium]